MQHIASWTTYIKQIFDNQLGNKSDVAIIRTHDVFWYCGLLITSIVCCNMATDLLRLVTFMVVYAKGARPKPSYQHCPSRGKEVPGEYLLWQSVNALTNLPTGILTQSSSTYHKQVVKTFCRAADKVGKYRIFFSSLNHYSNCRELDNTCINRTRWRFVG